MAYNPSAGLLRKLEFCSYGKHKKWKYRSSLLSTSATPVHTEDRAAAITFQTVILSGLSKRNFVNHEKMVKHNLLLSLDWEGMALPMNLISFVKFPFLMSCGFLRRRVIVLRELLPWLEHYKYWLHSEFSVTLQFFYYADFHFTGLLLMI